MNKSTTTSIRLSPEMRHDLEQAARVLHRGKNWIINEALRNFLEKLTNEELIKEARRQSLLASKDSSQEDMFWEENSDTTDWE